MKKAITVLSAFLMFFAFHLNTFSQKLIIPETNSFNGQFFRYDLPTVGNFTVTCFYMDRKGFLWLGTYQGLFRFNGSDFKEIPGNGPGKKSGNGNIYDSTGFAGKLVSSICEDTEGNIWFGTSGGLNFYDIRKGTFANYFADTVDFMGQNNKVLELLIDRNGIIWITSVGDIFSFDTKSCLFTRYPVNATESKNIAIPYYRQQGRILEDDSGNIWFATRKGLYMHDRNNDSLVTFTYLQTDPDLLAGNSISCLAKDTSGNVWISTYNKGLYRAKDPATDKFERIDLSAGMESSMNFDSIRVILPDQDGSLWLFGNKLFGEYIPATGRFKPYICISPSKIKELNRPVQNDFLTSFAFQGAKNDIFFLSEDGLFIRFFKKTEQAIIYRVPNFANFDAISDTKGSFWFSCPFNWVFNLETRPFTFPVISMQHSTGRSFNNQQRITEDSEHKIWFTLNSGIFVADSIDKYKFFNPAKYYFPDGVGNATSVYRDHNNNLWFTRSNGSIAMIYSGSGKMKVYNQTGQQKKVFNIIKEDNYGNIWISARYNIFRVARGSDEIERVDINNKELNEVISDEGLYDFYPDKQDRLWFGLRDNKVWYYNFKTKTYNYIKASYNDKLKYGDICTRIKEDNRGRIWFLFMTEGLYLFDPENHMIRHIDISEGDNNNLFLDLLVDNKDRLWISHLKGVTIYDHVSGSSGQIRVEQPENPCFTYQLSTGNVLLHNLKDLILFEDPVQSNPVPPEIFVTSLKVNDIEYTILYPSGDEIRTLKKVRLKNYQNNLIIEFVALNYLKPKYNLYRYFMKGIDDDTINAISGIQFTGYKKMKPGKYEFWVSGSNNDGIWNPSGKTLEITISSPWYSSRLAFIIYFILSVSLISFFVRWRLHQLKRDKLILEAEVRLRTRELKEKNDQIQELDRVKTRFFTEISHEIRTPLSLIVGPIENLIRENDTIEEDRRIKWMEMIRRNSRRLLKLVNQLLDISKLDAGKMKITLVESNILGCLRILVYEYLSLAESRKIRYIVEIPDDSYITYFDRDKTEKIISNLLSNAFKFTPSWGSVSCKVEIAEAKEENTSSRLNVSVRDSGVGISQENIGKIFDRFYRNEGQWEKDGTGTGIGLALVHEFVSLLHGEINVTSESGSGSTFLVSIPLGKDHLPKDEYIILDMKDDEDTAATIFSDRHLTENEEEPDSTEKNISLLIIEDNKDLRTFIYENLATEYHVYEAENGKKGQLVALAKIPDLIITDILMPDINGIELCSILKNDERTSHIPLIILTAKTTLDEKIEGLKAGADDYLYKPFDINELKIRISNLIIQREKLRLKYGLLTGLEQPDSQKAGVDERFMTKVVSIIKENIRDFDFDVGVLQEKVGMSRVHLYRKIKAITGLSPGILIRNMRMKHAATLIGQHAGNLTMISLSVGFSNPSYFSKCFREYYGVSPKDFDIKLSIVK